MADNNLAASINNDMEAIEHFMGLKQSYEESRQPWKTKWLQALAAFRVDWQTLDGLYKGHSRFISPIMKWKTRGLVSRVMRSMFSQQPFARIEDKRIRARAKDTVVELWNKYIFEHQLPKIQFQSSYREHWFNKEIFGTAIAKITQEYEEKELDIFENEDPEKIIVKDDTYFRPLLINSFYTDPTKTNLQDSEANIHSTVISWEDLKADEERDEVEEFELVDQETGQVVGTEKETKKKGFYRNLDLLEPVGDNLSIEQTEYIQLMGLNKKTGKTLRNQMIEAKKTGFVPIDECYGKYWIEIDGETVRTEVICTIAFENFVIRMEPTPFKHRRLVRPFIAGRKETITNSFYADSNITAGEWVFKELNASRQQKTDAKTRSIANMWYQDVSKQVVWDGQWRPNGRVKGNGPNGLEPLINPYLGPIATDTVQESQRDLDQLFSQSPVQEGTTDKRQIPNTATGTSIVVAQNDIPINDEINESIEQEIKEFLEIIYERNILFKDIKDLLVVWDEKDILKFAEELGIEVPQLQEGQELANEQFEALAEQVDMRALYFEPNIKIQGKVELSNEIAHQMGWMAYGRAAQEIPILAKRTNWSVYGDKLLRSFGIKDDSSDLFHSPETIAQVDQQQSQANAMEKEQAIQEQLALDQDKRDKDTEDFSDQETIKTINRVKEMQAEVFLQDATGEKI